MFRKAIVYVLIFIILIALLPGCGKKGGQQGGEGGGQVGEPVTVNNLQIILNSSSVVSNKVKANFTVKNNGTGNLVIDPATFFTFSAESEGEEVNMEIDPTCRKNVLRGDVPAGGELTGDVCWRSDPTLTWPATARIRYGDVIWEVGGEE